MSRRIVPWFLSLTCLLSSTLCLGQDIERPAKIVSFAVPGSLFTGPAAINNLKTVTGTYVSSTGDQPGFIRRFDGVITTFSVPGSGQTIPTAINDLGEIAGSYIESPNGGAQICFARSREGNITVFTPATSNGSASVTGMNEDGTVVGYYTDDFTGPAPEYGFLRHRDGVVETIAVAGSAETSIAGINARGDVTGFYKTGTGYIAGFVRSAQGKVTTFDFGTAVLPTSINDAGTVTGYYLVLPVPSPISWNHVFIRSADGAMTTFTPPGTIWASRLGLNNAGTITGNYVLSPTTANPAAYFGLVRQRDGKVTTIAPKVGFQTMTTGINQEGDIIGYYYNVNGPGAFGFLRTPARR